MQNLKACQEFSTEYKKLAQELSDDNIEVGAVNCETENKVRIVAAANDNCDIKLHTFKPIKH